MTLDGLSIVLGVALYPAFRVYYRTMIAGVNTLREFKQNRTQFETEPKAFLDIARFPKSRLPAKFPEPDNGPHRCEQYEEGEYAIEI